MSEEITCAEITNEEFRRLRYRTCPFLLYCTDESDLKHLRVINWMNKFCKIFGYVLCYYIKWNKYKKYEKSELIDRFSILRVELDRKTVALSSVSKSSLYQLFKKLNREIYLSPAMMNGFHKITFKKPEYSSFRVSNRPHPPPYTSPLHELSSDSENSNNSDKEFEISFNAAPIITIGRQRNISTSLKPTNTSGTSTSTLVTQSDPRPNTQIHKFFSTKESVRKQLLQKYTPKPRHHGKPSNTVTLSQLQESSSSTSAHKRPRSKESDKERHTSKKARTSIRTSFQSSSKHTLSASSSGSDSEYSASALVKKHFRRSLIGISLDKSNRSNRSTPSPNKSQSSSRGTFQVRSHQRETPITTSHSNICYSLQLQHSDSNQTKNSDGHQSTPSTGQRLYPAYQTRVASSPQPRIQKHTPQQITHTPLIINPHMSSQHLTGSVIQRRKSVIMTPVGNKVSTPAPRRSHQKT